MKRISIKIPEYDPNKGMEYSWEDGFEISTDANSNTIKISANKEGLISLAKHLLTLAEFPTEGHLHYDDLNSLEDGSIELIIDKI
ncbi:MAG: hypothetical protein EOL98_13100 [Negativicutes bacterium]|nr:hypothetical protein [Negativicutes bacterium]